MNEDLLEPIIKAFIEELSEKSTYIFKGLEDNAKQLLKTGIKKIL